MTKSYDIIIIGAGIAGASAGAELADDANVAILEMESQSGYHATGRSAAFFAAAYGNKTVRGITAACESFFRSPPDSFSEVELLRPRDCLFVGREDQRQDLVSLKADIPFLKKMSAEQVLETVPIFSSDYIDSALCDNLGGDLDVDALLQGYLRLFKKRGGEILTRHCVDGLRQESGVWYVTAGDFEFQAPVIINAAGAWADEIASAAGLHPIGLKPLRRTAILIDAPEDQDITNWPLVIDASEEFYFKPDAGQLLISPANEDLCSPSDVQPEELDIAYAVDRFERATNLQVRRVNHSWAGMRTFSPDRNFVVGFDPRKNGFFWLAGQGGYGVQTAPGLAHLTNALICNSQPPGSFAEIMEFASTIVPDRLV